MQFLPSITILYAGIAGFLLLVLSLNIFREWVNIALSEGGEDEARWKRAERLQHSFVEFVPISLLLLFLIEAHGAPAGILHALGIGLLAARILHAYGMGNGAFAHIMRVIGTQGTFLVLMIESLAAIYYALVPLLVGR